MSTLAHPKNQLNAGFTLVEIGLAGAILVVVVTMALSGLIYFLSEVNKADKQSELDLEVQVSMEHVRRNLRLTAIDQMFYYPPGPGPYSAVSFPLARDDDGDGAVEMDSENKIIWDKTLVYHAWTSEPNQLRLTTFDTRDGNLSATERQEQINAVAGNGTGLGTHNGTNASTVVIFENVFTWSVRPKSGTFNAYSENQMREINAVLGSVALSNGNHTFEFIATDKDTDSTGYKIGIDYLFASPSYSIREGEGHVPPTSQTGAVASNQYMTTGTWNGNHQLVFPATATGHTFTLTLDNDRWVETNFRQPGELHEYTVPEFYTEVYPFDFVVLLEGYETNWYADLQSGDTNSASTTVDAVRGCAVRVLLRGGDMEFGSWIETSGAKCRVNFKSGAGALGIKGAFIAEADSTSSNTMDAVAGSMTPLTFSGSDLTVLLAAGTERWSDLVDFQVDSEKSYLVSYLVPNLVGSGTTWQWQETRSPAVIGTYVIPATSSPDVDDTNDDNWSSRGDVIALNAVLGVDKLFTSHPTNGIYTSTIFDTQLSSPQYLQFDWTEQLPANTYIFMKLRTGYSNDLSDAASWSSISPVIPPAAPSPGNGRYVQFQAELQSNPATSDTPKLLDVLTRWTGETRIVDIGGTFTMGPDYGIFKLLVDGQALTRGVVIDLEIYDYIRSHGSSNRITSAVSTEVTPRNTGR